MTRKITLENQPKKAPRFSVGDEIVAPYLPNGGYVQAVVNSPAWMNGNQKVPAKWVYRVRRLDTGGVFHFDESKDMHKMKASGRAKNPASGLRKTWRDEWRVYDPRGLIGVIKKRGTAYDALDRKSVV